MIDLPVSHQPRWCAPQPDVCFADVLRACHAGDRHQVSLLSLRLAFRPARFDLGESVAVVPVVRWLPTHSRWSLTRLQARWEGRSGVTERTTLYALTGLTLEDVGRLGGRPGLPWLLHGTEDGVKLIHGGETQDIGRYSPETILSGIGRALGVPHVEVERPAQGWIEGLLASRFEPPDTRPQTAP